MSWLRSGRWWRAWRRWWCIEGRLSCPASVGVCFLEHDEFATIFQRMSRPPFPFFVQEKVEGAGTRKFFPCHVVIIEWRCKSRPPLAILWAISSGVAISKSTGSISGATISGDTLRCVTLVETCSDHLGSVVSVITVGSALPSPVATMVWLVLVSRIVLVIVFSWPYAIPTHGVFSFSPLVGDLHEVSNGGRAETPKFFIQVFAANASDKCVDRSFLGDIFGCIVYVCPARDVGAN